MDGHVRDYNSRNKSLPPNSKNSASIIPVSVGVTLYDLAGYNIYGIAWNAN